MPNDQEYNKTHEITTSNTVNKSPKNHTQPSYLVLQSHTAISLKNRTDLQALLPKRAEGTFTEMTGNALEQVEQKWTILCKGMVNRRWSEECNWLISGEHQNPEHRMRHETEHEIAATDGSFVHLFLLFSKIHFSSPNTLQTIIMLCVSIFLL